ncbi:hypothetical protein PFX98_01315 [Paucibacter sediminis]|uniref:Uncharacterized protein n=1 Tax=Paucibacter sediminis TaxID=3019553 RepID=A0AA95NJW9_9BURK|nr:hypothetical protein [Paucibacter sp. S2-9]WIT12271.1 hypothetical protein PFX98_01315 [Paucibacter sp. S2-9]
MAIGTDGRFTPNATKGALELFSATDMARVLHKLDCGLTRDQVALMTSAYEQLFTPATVRRSRNGLVRERLMRKVQEVFTSARLVQPVAAACAVVHDQVLDVRDGDWAGLNVRLAVALGMDPEAAECARAVIQLRREQGKWGEDARFAAEQFTELWSKADGAALDDAREVESILRDVSKTCMVVAQKGALDGFKAADEGLRREAAKLSGRQWSDRSPGRRQSATLAQR